LNSEYLTNDVEHCSSSATTLLESNQVVDHEMEDAILMELDNNDDVIDEIPCKKER